MTYIWKGSPVLELVLGIASLGKIMVAGLAGAGMPLVLRRVEMDPALYSAVLVTTFTDIIGFLLFFLLAAFFIEPLS